MTRSTRRNARFGYLAVLVLLVGFALRADYLRHSSPYVDEYFTMTAARMIQGQGYPLLPTGLFYSHGLLYSYVVALLGGLMTATGPLAGIEQVEMIYRLPNLLLSAGVMAVLFAVSRRWFGSIAALIALALMAVYPHGILWGSRVRMYTLVFLFVPLLSYAFYRAASRPDDRGAYVAALLLLLAAVLTHNWVVVLVPILLLAGLVVGWGQHGAKILRWRWWLPGVTAIGLIVALSLALQSFWEPVSIDAAAGTEEITSQRLLGATVGRLSPLASLDGAADLLRRFVWQNPFNLIIVSGVLAGTVGLWRLGRSPHLRRHFWPMLYLCLLFWGAAAEMLLLLHAGLQQPRYAAPILLLGLIIVGGWLAIGLSHVQHQLHWTALQRDAVAVALMLLLLVGLGWLSLRQLPRLFYEGLPPFAYDQAFQYIRAHAASSDPVLTPLPAAAAMHLDNPLFFVAQQANHTFVWPDSQGGFTDRWVGAPWLRTAGQFKETLRTAPTVWLAVDQFSFETQFGATWQQLLRHNTKMVWAEKGVMVFRGQGLVYDFPTEPDMPLAVRVGDRLELAGYSRRPAPDGLHLTLFWQVLSSPSADYTTFVHVRNQAGQTVAQVDAQPLEGQYPTSRWRTGELVTDEILLPLPTDLPPDTYRLLVGLYRWDTLARLPVANDASGENAIELESITLNAGDRQ